MHIICAQKYDTQNEVTHSSNISLNLQFGHVSPLYVRWYRIVSHDQSANLVDHLSLAYENVDCACYGH